MRDLVLSGGQCEKDAFILNHHGEHFLYSSSC